jgi:hypothetical protein
VLDKGADVRDWAARSKKAKAEIDGKLYNCCELLPEKELQFKLFPDETELCSGILPGADQRVFNLMNRGLRF